MLQTIMATLTDSAGSLDFRSQLAPHAEALVAAAPALRDALQIARYHQIGHVRDAAVPALAELSRLVPEPASPRTPRPTLQPVRGRRPARSTSRKGPWLHQQLASASPTREGARQGSDAATLRSSRSPFRRQSSRFESASAKCNRNDPGQCIAL